MGNETYHYLGAYLEIKVRQIEEQKTIITCGNNHRGLGVSPFCPRCGLHVIHKEEITLKYPHLYQLLSFDQENLLSGITPQSIYGTDTIIATGNQEDGGCWLHLDRWSEIEMSDFPNPENLIRELENNYSNVIDALRNHSDVISVTIKCGYVQDAEF